MGGGCQGWVRKAGTRGRRRRCALRQQISRAPPAQPAQRGRRAPACAHPHSHRPRIGITSRAVATSGRNGPRVARSARRARLSLPQTDTLARPPRPRWLRTLAVRSTRPAGDFLAPAVRAARGAAAATAAASPPSAPRTSRRRPLPALRPCVAAHRAAGAPAAWARPWQLLWLSKMRVFLAAGASGRAHRHVGTAWDKG